jgi:GNAT superfamily N-acetyltransferase
VSDRVLFDGGMDSPATPSTSVDDATSLAVEAVPFSHPEVQRLVDEVQAHYVELYGGPDASPVDPHEFDPPQGCFLLGTVGGVGTAMGGWRRRPEVDELFGGVAVAELKRMYVAPAGRRRGHARTVLERLEATARERGVEFLALETGTVQTGAIALYEAAGYSPCARFGHYADSELARHLGKDLRGR